MTTQLPILRQVILGTSDLAGTVAALRDHLGLAAGFGDPLLAEVGLADETIRVGPQAYLEVVAPLHADAQINRWLAKTSGGGYALSIQVDAIDPILARARTAGIGVAADLEAYGHRIVQLHPRDMGLLVELDEIADPDVWFWDHIETDKPAAPLVDDIAAVEFTAPDAAAFAHLWSTLFGVPVLDDPVTGAPGVRLGSRTVRFLDGDELRMHRIILAATANTAPADLVVNGVELGLR